MGKKIIYAVDEESGGVTSWSPEANGGAGSDGLSAYEVAVNRGFSGTEAEWLESLKGPQGPTGPQGEDGPQGPQGEVGPAGSVGAQGPKGDTGLQGPKGDTGNPGPKGDTGDIGPQGIKGDTGDTGPQGPPGEDGAAGTTDWAGITNKPSTFTPSTHTHPISEVTNLQTALDGKASSNHNHDSAYSPLNHTHAPTYAVLANGATTMALATNNTVKVTPTANATYTTTVPPAGTICYIIILTSGTTSRTITFGTGFKPTATLATGTVSGRVFVVGFISDGTNLYEVSRTVAMVA